jgi:hypothetical protein
LTPTASSLLTLADWQRAYRDGLSPTTLLARFVEPAAPSDVAWIQRADAVLLNELLDELRER